MLNKDITKKLSAILAAAMIASCGMTSFADTDTTETTTQDEITTPTDPTTPVIPDTLEMNISANYTHNETDGTYTVVFTSLTELDELRDFNFTIGVTAEGATIKSATFSPALQEDNYSAVTTKATSVAFADGAKTTSVSGKVVLCTVTINSSVDPTSENVTLTGFTAVDKDGNTVTVTPALSVTNKPIIPELSDNAKAAYDMIVALPASDSLSFYTDSESKTLADISEISKNITETVKSYNALSSDEKDDIKETLTFYNKTLDGLETLNALALDMQTVADIMTVAQTFNSLTEENLLNYMFLSDVYTEAIAIDESKKPTFTNGSTLKTQYEQAETDISTQITAMKEAYDDFGTTAEGFEKKIKLIDSQLEIVQTLFSEKYYENYLDALITQTDNLKTELGSYSDGSVKDALLKEIESSKQKISIIKEGMNNLPEFEIANNRINRQYNYKVNVTRDKKVALEAEVKVKVYLEDDTDKEIDSKTAVFAEGETELEITIYAAAGIYPGNDNVIISVDYTIEKAEFSLGSKTVYCQNTSSSQRVPGIQSSSTSGSSSSSSGGTRFPSASDDEEDEDSRNDTEEFVLFNDIEKYDWAKEAIEGLYYAGIINGMEEGVFNPAGNVTREQFCKMVVQLFEVLENETESNFNDVDPNAWYAPYICSAIRAGYVQGQSYDYFGIGESIMRQDMATILYRAIGEQNSRAVLDFTDTDNIAPYAEDAISELVGLGVLSGYEDGSFKPRGTATRAEAAKVIWGIYNIINE